jgi:hypothetical protein
MTLLERYVAGERVAVWDELVALGAAVRDEPIWSEARAVARETMQRARRNIDRLVGKLHAVGYSFRLPSTFEAAGSTPARDAAARVREAERLVGGPLPLSLAAFYEEVGSVCLAGTHPGWRSEYIDRDPGGSIRLMAYKDPLWIPGA